MTLGTLYLFMVILPNLHSFAASPSVILPILGLIGGLFGYFMASDCGVEKFALIFLKMVKCSIGAIIFIAFAFIVSPSDTQIYTLAGGYTVTNTKDIGKLPDNIIGAANAWLKKAAESAEDNKKK